MPSRWRFRAAPKGEPVPGFGDSNVNVLDVVPVVNTAVNVEL